MNHASFGQVVWISVYAFFIIFANTWMSAHTCDKLYFFPENLWVTNLLDHLCGQVDQTVTQAVFRVWSNWSYLPQWPTTDVRDCTHLLPAGGGTQLSNSTANTYWRPGRWQRGRARWWNLSIIINLFAYACTDWLEDGSGSVAWCWSAWLAATYVILWRIMMEHGNETKTKKKRWYVGVTCSDQILFKFNLIKWFLITPLRATGCRLAIALQHCQPRPRHAARQQTFSGSHRVYQKEKAVKCRFCRDDVHIHELEIECKYKCALQCQNA